MTELDLYKFIQENNIEWHRYKKDIIIFVNFSNMPQFLEILTPSVFDDDGIVCNLKRGYIGIVINEICDYYGIIIDNVFKGNNWED